MKFNSPVMPWGFIPDPGALQNGVSCAGRSSTYWGVEEKDPARDVRLLFSLVTTALKMIQAIVARSVICSCRGLITLLQLL